MYHANAAFAVGTYHTNAHFRRAITTKTILINAKSVTIKVRVDKGRHGFGSFDEKRISFLIHLNEKRSNREPV